MPLTEQEISKKLGQAMVAAGLASDGYSELEHLDEAKLRCAAVLVALLWQADAWQLLYTRRTERVDSHKGQVSFPGGACDEGESRPEQTALRGLQAELGMNPD